MGKLNTLESEKNLKITSKKHKPSQQIEWLRFFLASIISEFSHTKINKLCKMESIESSSPYQLNLVFPCTLYIEIASYLQKTQKNELSKFIKMLCSWLLTQQTRQKAWNWWQIKTNKHRAKSYPDDLDDTACAWSALFEGRKDRLFLKRMVKTFLPQLFSLEVKPGGPYRTWYLNGKEKKWKTIDPVVNANLAYFLLKLKALPDSLVLYIATSLSKSLKSSPYYPPWTTIYFFSRMYSLLPLKQQKFPKILSLRKKYISEIRKMLALTKPDELMKNSMLITSTFRLGRKDLIGEEAIYMLTNCQFLPKPEKFCVDQIKKNHTVYVGSIYLTKALVAETVGMYLSYYDLSSRDSFQFIRAIPKLAQQLIKQAPLSFQKEITLFVQSKTPELQKHFAYTMPAILSEVVNGAIKKKHRGEIIATSLSLYFGWLSLCALEELAKKENRKLTAILFSLAILTGYCLKNERGFFNLKSASSTAESHSYHSKDREKRMKEAIKLMLYPIENSLNENQYDVLKKSISIFFASKQLQDDLNDWREDISNHVSTPITKLLLDIKPVQREKLLNSVVFEKYLFPMEKQLFSVLNLLKKADLKNPKELSNLLEIEKVKINHISLHQKLSQDIVNLFSE